MMDLIKATWSDFPKLSLFAGCIAAALCVTLFFAPGVIHWLFRIDSPSSTDVMSGRAGMLFAGLSVILFGARDEPPSPLRATVSLGVAVTMAGLALVGLFDLLRGAVGLGILLAIAVEVFFASAFWRFSRRT